ncbi:MAG: class I SAM-dependent DNA methyltransferase, partial [Promethearchaeota archaeon]
MRSQTSSKRKILGQYYTPDYIVEFMVYHTIAYLHKKTNYNNANLLKVLDPACGAGIFLVQALKFFLSHYSASKSNSLSEEVRKSIIADQLYGIDIDDYQIAKTLKSLNCLNFNANFKVFNALLPPPSFNHSIDSKMLKKLRLHYKEIYKSTNDISSFKEVQKRIFEIEKRVKKTLTAKLIELFQIPSNNIDPMPWETVFPETDGKFDVILGNPPWGAELFSSNLLNCYRVGTQQVDSWSLFLEKSLMALKEGGRLGFVIPNTLLLNENYTDTRKFILEVCKIIKIINLGENVFSKITQPCMILIVEKQSSIFDHKVEVIRFIPAKAKELLKKGQRKISSLYTIPCNQGRFLENLDYQLDIFSIGFEKFKELIEKDVFSSKIEVLPLRDL